MYMFQNLLLSSVYRLLIFGKMSVKSGTPLVGSGTVPGEKWDTDTDLILKVIYIYIIMQGSL